MRTGKQNFNSAKNEYLRILNEGELNKTGIQLNEEDEYIDISCCPDIAGCSCNAQIIGGVVQNCCQHYFSPGGCCNPTGVEDMTGGPRATGRGLGMK